MATENSAKGDGHNDLDPEDKVPVLAAWAMAMDGLVMVAKYVLAYVRA